MLQTLNRISILRALLAAACIVVILSGMRIHGQTEGPQAATVTGIQGEGVVVYSPFMETNRRSLATLRSRIVGRYGDYRSSYKTGHLHAGIDLKGEFREIIYAIGGGEVVRVTGSFPNRTVAIAHVPASGEKFYSLYAHLEDIRVKRGDRVNRNTPLGRLFTKEELTRSNFGTPNHVHLEIRKNMDDSSRASTHSMTRAELNRHCIDPLEFFRKAFATIRPL